MIPVHKYFLFNGEVKDVNEFVSFENDGGIYEVLRVERGIPLFLQEHLRRFYMSARIAGKNIIYSKDEIESFIKVLIDKNGVKNGNVLISSKTNLKAFYITHSYPNIEQYLKGVVCGVLHAERETPNAKVFQTSVRQNANKLIREHALYEVLLIDHEGKVTEGSRSNVFFIKGNRITTPSAQKVLLGITRQKIIECATRLNYLISEKDVRFDTICAYDAVFLTGTSPKVLPISKIENCTFNPGNEVLKKLMADFDNTIDDYIKNARL